MNFAFTTGDTFLTEDSEAQGGLAYTKNSRVAKTFAFDLTSSFMKLHRLGFRHKF
jgi:hypothetical protein